MGLLYNSVLLSDTYFGLLIKINVINYDGVL